MGNIESKIKIEEMSEADIPRYGPIFAAVGDLFGDYSGIYFKLIINGEEKVLQRKEDLFVVYSVEEGNLVSYEMFTVDEDYVVNNAGFDDFEMMTYNGDRIVQDRGTGILESMVFTQRKDGVDIDGYDGTVGYVQYNQEEDVRLILLYQQMYNDKEKVYSFHVDKKPFQILIEKGVGAKDRGSIIPVRNSRYIRCDYDAQEHSTGFNIATIKDFGLIEFLRKGAYALQKADKITRYYRVLGVASNGYAITGFPFLKQYQLDDFSTFFEQYGFKTKVPYHLIAIHNDEYDDLTRYQEIASFMQEIEKEPPAEVVELKLKFERGSTDGSNN